MVISRIAFRNIFRQRRRTLLTALTLLGGFVLCAIAIGWSDGTYAYTIDMFTRNRMGHIQIHGQGYTDKPSLYNTIDNYEEIGSRIMAIDGIQAWAPRLYSSGLVSVGEKTAGVSIIGINPRLEEASTSFSKKIIKGESFSAENSNEVILGKGLAEILKADIDSEVVIISQAADGSIANDIYRIVGIAESGDESADQTAFYMSLKDSQKLLVMEGRIHEIVIIVEKLGEVKKLAGNISRTLNDNGLAVEPWQEFARYFYVAMKADQQGAWIMVFIIAIIVAVGVLNTVLMTVLERVREYGMLKAIGTRPSQIFKLIIIEIDLITLASVVLGIGLSALLNYLLSIKGIAMPEPMTYGGIEFTHMYSVVSGQSLYIPALTVFITATIVAVFPAIKAARTSPAKAMRTH
jgi:putative ABC transport system permease protein